MLLVGRLLFNREHGEFLGRAVNDDGNDSASRPSHNEGIMIEAENILSGHQSIVHLSWQGEGQ